MKMPHILDYDHDDICKDDPSERFKRCDGVYCEMGQQCASHKCEENKCVSNDLLIIILLLMALPLMIWVLLKIFGCSK